MCKLHSATSPPEIAFHVNDARQGTHFDAVRLHSRRLISLRTAKPQPQRSLAKSKSCETSSEEAAPPIYGQISAKTLALFYWRPSASTFEKRAEEVPRE